MSIVVAPPEATGAYLSSLTIKGIVVIVSSSLKKFVVKPNVPISAPNNWVIKGPESVYQP